MILSDVKDFEAWFKARRGISFAEAQPLAGREDLRMVKAAYAEGMRKATLATALLAMREHRLVQIGWRWHHPEAPTGHQYSPIFTDDKPGPPSHAIAAAQNSSFGPTTVQPVYVLADRSSEKSQKP